MTKHRTPWETGADVKPPAFDDDVWELYDTTTDWTQAHDLAAQHPGKLHELQRLWLIEAVKYQVVPLDDRFVERGLPEMAGRPSLIQGKRQLLFSGMGRLTENSVVNNKNASFSLTAEVMVPEQGAEGVIVAQGGVTGGLSLYAKGGKPKYCYNFFGLERYYVEGTTAIPSGTHQVRMESPTTAAVSARAGPRPSTSTARRPAKAALSRPRPSCSPPTRPSMSATSTAPPTTASASSTARSTGSRSTSASTTTTP